MSVEGVGPAKRHVPPDVTTYDEARAIAEAHRVGATQVIVEGPERADDEGYL